MEEQIRPSLFYGTAVSACLGLALGLALHGPWQSRAGGPQILFASAAASELARAPNDADLIEAAAPAEQPAYPDITLADIGPLPADPLPVTRLARSGGSPLPAHADIQRVSADTLDPDTRDDLPSDLTAETASADPALRYASQAASRFSYRSYESGF